MSEFDEPSISRRWLLRIGGLLGLGTAGAVAVGAASTAPGAAASRDTPDPTGAFGHAPSAEAALRQQRRAGATVLSRSDISPGVASGSEPISAFGARLDPSTTVIDHTPLARRDPRGTWVTGE